MTSDTIAAIATPPGKGGVGIVRVSGPDCRNLALALIGRLPEPRQALYCRFRAADGSVIDQGIALYFPAPRSFTGEDILELQGHGGVVVMDLLLGRCLELGARLARPGELTERAFLNGKLDLAQAEAVADLIESATALGAKLAARSLQGVFSQRIEGAVEGLIRARTYLEATLDFPDEEVDPLGAAALASELEEIVASVEETLALAHQGERIRDGLRVVIAGPPNAGKSSLLNALAETDRAIVTPIPGTTRDVLQVDIQIEGLPVRLIDTAGIRETTEPVEREGVRRARDQLTHADLILWVFDGTQEQQKDFGLEQPPGIPVVFVRNKVDIARPALGAPSEFGYRELWISALTGEGLPELRRQLRKSAGIGTQVEGAFLARRRHLDALSRGLESLRTACAALERGSAAELIALDLREAQEAFGEITGAFSSEDLLGRIFSTFCIGK